MAGKKGFSAVVVKSFKCFCQIFPVPDSESGQSCGVLELEGAPGDRNHNLQRDRHTLKRDKK